MKKDLRKKKHFCASQKAMNYNQTGRTDRTIRPFILISKLYLEIFYELCLNCMESHEDIQCTLIKDQVKRTALLSVSYAQSIIEV
jgi:hypothetical protein